MEPNFSKDNIVFWTKSSNIDRMVCRSKGISFNEELAKLMDRTARFYFVINKEGQSKVISGISIESYRVKNKGRKKYSRIYQPLEDCKIEKEEVKTAIKEYCQSVHGVNVLI